MSQAVAQSPEALAAHGRARIAEGSKSFAMASLLFGREMQADVEMLYAWCRRCDDVIDGQDLGGDAPDRFLTPAERAGRLENLQRLTERALDGEATGDPAFDGFSAVARKHRLPRRLAMDHLDGFAMDVQTGAYRTLEDTLDYCYGVAGSVGVMMAILMGVASDDAQTLDRACDLGIAFQLTNICRDVLDDARAGRVYLPADFLEENGVDPASESVIAQPSREGVARAVAAVLDEADRYYRSASFGLRRLPPRAAAAVAAARNVYRDIGRIVREAGVAAWDARARTSPARKSWLAFAGAVSGAPQPLFLKNLTAPPRDAALWTRPAR